MNAQISGAIRQLGRDAFAAFCALALVFLSFGHQPVGAQGAGAETFIAQGLYVGVCGDPADPGDQSSNGPCHACRTGIADVPPPLCDAVPAFGGLVLADAWRPSLGPALVVSRTPFAPRAPPALV
jgi:hypothetical protein